MHHTKAQIRVAIGTNHIVVAATAVIAVALFGMASGGLVAFL